MTTRWWAVGAVGAALAAACAQGAQSDDEPSDDGGDGGATSAGGAGGSGAATSSSAGGGPECSVASDCDDGDACTNDNCSALACAHTEVICDDGAFCNGAESCDPTAGCQPGAAPEVDDEVACTEDSCEEDRDEVVNAPDDGNCPATGVCITSSSCDVVDDCVVVEAPVCATCTGDVYDNGSYDSVDGLGANSWNLDGIIDDFSWPGGDLCGVELTMLRNGTLVEFQQLRVRIYSLAGGGLDSLGTFTNATPAFDQTYLVSNGSLAIVDSGVDAFGYDVLSYGARGYTFALPAGDYGLHLIFPDHLFGQQGFWPTSAPQGSGDCAHVWGDITTTAQDTCTTLGPQFERLDFRVNGPS